MHKIAECTKTKSSEELEIVHFDHANAWKTSQEKIFDTSRYSSSVSTLNGED